jgi:predicted  nucleic acid-binding Zn-ribbon protein
MAEHAVADQQAKLREAETKLYGGTVQNPKELQDLQRDSESLKRHLSTLDDRLLEAMLVQEEADKAVQASSSEVEGKETERVGALDSLRSESERLRAAVDRHSLEREPVVAGVPPEDLALYERLRQSSGGVAVARVKDGACGVCGLILAASGAQEVRSSAAPVRCRQCGRVLYAG